MIKSQTPIYLVVDGIDECQDSMGDLFTQLRGIISSSPRLKIALLGRSHVFEGQVSTHLIHIANELLKIDLKAFITTETEKSELLKQPKHQQMVINDLLEKADGMFLWARLSINELCGAYYQDDIRRILQRLPSGIENTYDRILHEIITSSGETGLECTKHILGFLVASGRTLELKELQHAYAVASRMGRPEFERDNIDAYKGPDPAKMFLRACRGLINIDNDKVSLVHLTAKEYLTKAAAQWNSKISILRVSLAEAHELFANVCVESINDDGFEWFHKREGLFLSQGLDYPPLFSYAFRFTTYHFNRMQDPHPETVARIRCFVNKHLVSWFELLIVSCFMDGPMAVTMQEFWEAAEWFTDDPFDLTKSTITNKERFQTIYKAHAGNYWQSQRLRLLGEFFNFVDENDPSTSCSAPPSKQKERIRSKRAMPLSQENLSQVIQLLADHHTLPLPKQADLMSKLGQMFRRQGHMKDLLSPFDMLFRLFKSKINSFPTVVLIGFGGLCRGLKRPQNSLEIFNIVLTRLSDNDEEMRYQVWELMGFSYGDIGEYEAAFNAHQRAWTGRRNLLGPKHRKTADSTYWMGHSLYKQKEYAEAEEYLRQALSLRKEACGLKDVDTASSIFWLGTSRSRQGNFTGAEGNFHQAESIRRVLVGSKHKEAATCMHWIGLSLHKQNKYAEAEGYLRQAASMRAAIFGNKDKSTASSIFWVGNSLFAQSKFAEAENNFRKAATLDLAILGACRVTSISISALGQAIYQQKRFTKAEEQFRRSKHIIEQKGLGPNDEHVLLNSLLLGLSLCCQRKFIDAESILRSAFTTPPKEASGVNFQANLWLARVLYYQQKHFEAERILTALLPMSDGKCDLDHTYSRTIIYFLGRSLNALAKYREAELMMRQVIIDEYGKMNSRTDSVDAGFEILRTVEEYEDDATDGEDFEPAEENEEDIVIGEDVDIDAETETETENEEDFGFYESWEFCHVHNIFSEYNTTGQNLEREGKKTEAEEIFSFLKFVEWI